MNKKSLLDIQTICFDCAKAHGFVPKDKACGNGWATNQPRWILTRILSMEGMEW